MNKIFSWLTVILWMALIFYFSHQPATASNQLSTGITEVIVEKIEKMAPGIEFDIGSFNHIVRKNAHFFIYFVLGMLVINAFRRSGVYESRSILFVIGICVLYATSDEVHQLFVPGRGAQVKDVLIDSAGASVGFGVYVVLSRIMKTRNTR